MFLDAVADVAFRVDVAFRNIPNRPQIESSKLSYKMRCRLCLCVFLCAVLERTWRQRGPPNELFDQARRANRAGVSVCI